MAWRSAKYERTGECLREPAAGEVRLSSSTEKA